MTVIEDLREAARLLRERAEAATPGPWAHAGDGDTFMGCGQVITVDRDLWGGDIAAPSGDLYPRSGYSPQDDMAYIASMHPLVGLALAEAFELEADHVVACRLGEQRAGAEPGILTGKRENAMHALALVYLGRTE